METVSTDTLVLALVGLFGSLAAILIFERKRRDGRIGKFLADFDREFQVHRRTIATLIPAGVNNLKNNREIELAFRNIQSTKGRHPLSPFENEIRKRDYKKFFRFAASHRDMLTKSTIGERIDEFKKR